MPSGIPSKERQSQDDVPTTGALSDAFFHAVVENAADMISVISPDGKFIYSSPNATRTFGIIPGTTNELPESVFHPDDYPHVVEAFIALGQQGGRKQLPDHRMRSADGDWMWMQTHAVNLVDDPRVGGIVMVSRDVTAQKRREEEISRAEIAVKFGHWRWDKNAPGPYWSDGMYAMLGLNRSDMPTDMAWTLDLLPPADQAVVITEVMEALTSGASFNRIVSMRHADGDDRRVMLMGHVERDGSGDATSIVGITQDVTALQEANDVIQQSEQEFRLLAEHSTDAIARYTRDGVVAYISPSVERVMSFKPEECIGHKSDALMHPEDLARVTAEIDSMHLTGQTKRVSFRMMSRSGEYLWLESAMSPLFGADGESDGFVACTRDVTAQKKHEQDLMMARERAEQASLTKSRFLANMSHELRTPLNAILGFSEMMTQQVFGPIGVPQYEEYAGMIHESGAHLLSLIGDILDMSKIEAGKYDLALEDVSVGTALQKATRMVQTRLREGELDLILDLEGAEGCNAWADERALTQVTINLLSNAVKFTPAGGRITVSARSLDTGRIAISIADTGVGIEAEDLERVLHPFEQVVRHAELASQGTGLGLPLVRALVELQDGTFSLTSKPGEGTVATITLPLAKPAASTVLHSS